MSYIMNLKHLLKKTFLYKLYNKRNINIEIYGDGLEKAHLEKLIHDNKLDKIIHLKGRAYE